MFMPLQQRKSIPDSAEVITKRIEKKRKERGFTASAFAKLVGVTPTAVWNWEKNSTMPRRPALEAIARVLGVTINFLYYGTGGENIPDPPKTADSVATIIEDTRQRLSQATGLALDRIKLNLQFTTE
jgi:transcriptional regulator with XRE-family HTH domain